MAKRAGRPPGAQNKVGKDQKEFIRGLLGDTQKQFRDAFVFYANASQTNQELRSKFVDLSIELSKMIVPKPVEADLNLASDSFQQLLGMFTAYDED